MSDPRVHRLEMAISYSLRIGVACSLVLVLTGLVLSYLRHPAWTGAGMTYEQLLGSGQTPWTSWPAVLAGVARGDSEALIMLGLLVLIGTPVLRVAVSIALFAYQNDRVFAAITAVVLALLLLSFAIGRAGG